MEGSASPRSRRLAEASRGELGLLEIPSTLCHHRRALRPSAAVAAISPCRGTPQSALAVRRTGREDRRCRADITSDANWHSVSRRDEHISPCRGTPQSALAVRRAQGAGSQKVPSRHNARRQLGQRQSAGQAPSRRVGALRRVSSPCAELRGLDRRKCRADITPSVDWHSASRRDERISPCAEPDAL